MPAYPETRCWKVLHARDGLETVHLVSAATKKQALDIAKTETEQVCCRHHVDCAWSCELFLPEGPYFLYAINRKTGAMHTESLPKVNSSCVVCLGNGDAK